MHTLVCRVFKWNYEQLLYGQTFLPTDIRFARANAPLKSDRFEGKSLIKSLRLLIILYSVNVRNQWIFFYETLLLSTIYRVQYEKL